MLSTRKSRGFGGLLALTVAFWTSTSIQADAATHRAAAAHNAYSRSHVAARWSHHGRYVQRGMLRRWASGLQCVPFARENSGIELSGNAGNWWDNAEGLYQRGARPEVGSILNFRPSGRMRMGHVAVVTNVIDSRHIEIDHANWSAPGRISRDIDVVDVSPSNDWTAVRVAIGQSEEDFGATYPTFGFIYDRPDDGVMVANTGIPAAPPGNNDRIQLAAAAPEEVAEAPDDETTPVAKAYGHRRFFHAHYHTAVFHTHGHGHSFTHAQLYRVSSHGPTHANHRRRF